MFRFVTTFLLLFASATTSLAQVQTDWKIKEESSYIVFVAKNVGLQVSGKISGMKINGQFDEADIRQSKLTGTLDVATIDTGIKLRDNHLRSDDYFDVKKFPTITFQTTSIVAEGSTLLAIGNLTIKGVTKEEKLTFTAEQKGDMRIFTGDITIQRRDYELGGKSALVMADKIRVRVFVVFQRVVKG